MSINLSDLTSPNNQDIFAEITSGADFLDPIGKLKNLSRSPNKGGHALQTTALNQPKALPLDANGKGYLYLSGVSGNDANVPDAANLDGFGDFTLQVDNLYLPDWTPSAQVTPIAKGSSWQFSVHTSGSFRLDMSGVSSVFSDPTGLADKTTASIRAVRAGSVFTFFYSLNDGATWVSVPFNFGGGSGVLTNVTQPLAIGSANLSSTVLGKVSGAKVWNNATQSGTPVLDVDFTATNVRHGDTKFKCATNQIVTINQDSSSSNDVATIIKKPVLRFDGVNDGLNGLFANNINGGYMFAAFSVLGNGGQSNGRVFGVSATGSADYQTNSAIFGYNANGALTAFNVAQHVGMFNDDNGDILLETKITNGSALSKVNNANTGTSSGFAIDSPHFNIATNAEVTSLSERTAIDLEFLALFSADSVPDEATASKIRNYINSRNQIYLRHQTDGYYFFDPQKATFTGNFTDVNTLDGYITGSDLGDTDVRSNLTLVQATLNDQPSTDGYTITFNDAAEHLEFENGASQNLSGWQIVGTSLGTFAYRVQGAVTELNLLGNAGAIRSIGDLYGIILLPASATGKDIEDARKLLIDRGASDGATVSSYQTAWYLRSDITEFKSVNMTGVTNVESAWNLSGLISFSTPLPSATNAKFAWYNNTSLSEFTTTDIKNGTDFTGAWQGCSALTSFPAGAKLGTEAANVNFTSAWQSSGLTSFPALDTSRVTNMNLAWYDSNLATFSLIDTSNVTQMNYAWGNTNLTSFPQIDPSSATSMFGAWVDNNLLTDFPAIFSNWNPSTITTGVFGRAWEGCSALSATSVENILTSIDASNQHGTDDGTSTGNPLGDSGIDIDYNTATGSLSAATNAAIDSLSGKGWQVIVNNVNLSLNNTYSVAFDGTDDYMSMTLPVLGNTHTLSAWFKTTTSYGGAGSEGTLISYISSGGGNDDSVLSVMTNKVGWSDFTDDNQFGTSTVNDGNWHHAVAVVTASTQKIYVDGVLETTTSNAYSAGTSFSSATIGRRANAAQRFFNGNIDEVAIWNSELSATDVTAIYNGGRPLNLNVNTNGYDNSSTLVAWWRMGDNESGTGSTVTDNSANSYNGTLINGPTFQTNTP